MKKLIFSIVVLILSWTPLAYGDDHQNISLSWTPGFSVSGDTRLISGSIEYIRHINSFKWGVGLEYPSHIKNPAYLSLRGEWLFFQKNNWLASLGAKIGGGSSSHSRHGSFFSYYIAPTSSLEYLCNEVFSGFIGFSVPVKMIGLVNEPVWSIEALVGLRFYF